MTDWEKLESMSDEDIDFSDCPEITPEMAKNSIVRRGLKSTVPRRYFVRDLKSKIDREISPDKYHESKKNT